MFVYDLPYPERKKLCRILDVNEEWEKLGGAFMNLDVTTLHHFRQAPSRNHSPTDEMLTLWGTQNHTVLELFVLLSEMQHYQAMTVLKNLVDEKYHRLIYEGEENFSGILHKKKTARVPPENFFPAEKKKEIFNREINGNLNINLNDEMSTFNKNSQKEKIKCDKALIDLSGVYQFEDVQKKPEYLNFCKAETLLNGRISPSITYAELEIATGAWNTKNLLGKGGFGTVYKGVWKNTDVAIKRLELQNAENMDDTLRRNREQSLRELKCLNSYRHDNILPLYGYSIGGPHDCLVYQYMLNGSLEDRLLCREGSKPLNWCQRHLIATGTARGLQFLHTIGDKPLIHGDIKSANVLLDPYLVPKIGDFGLAREGPLQQYTHIKISKVHGTRPYVPDEFLRGKKFSTKVDTYAFGIVLFELATGLSAYDKSRSHMYLKDHVDSFGMERINNLCDNKAGYDEYNSFSTLIYVGQWCAASRAKERPEMVDVLRKLEEYMTDQQSKQFALSTKISPVFLNQVANMGIHNSFASGRKGNLQGIVDPKLPEINIPIAIPASSSFHPNKDFNENTHDQTNISSEDDRIDYSEKPIIRVDPPSPLLSDQQSTTNRAVPSGCPIPLLSVLGMERENDNTTYEEKEK